MESNSIFKEGQHKEGEALFGHNILYDYINCSSNVIVQEGRHKEDIWAWNFVMTAHKMGR